MPWTMPPMPEELKAQLMRRQSPMGPAGAMPQAPYGPQPTPQTVAQNRMEEGGQPTASIQPGPSNLTPGPGVPIYRTPPPQTTSQPGSPGTPPPSDDPSVNPVGKPPDISSYLNPALARMNDLLTKRAAVPAIDPNQVKPRWWERALGVVLGATQLRNPENAGPLADSVVHRRLYGAERARNLVLQPLDQQIAAERESFPLYTAAGEAAYRQAELGQNANRENRERYTARTGNEYKTKWNDIREQRTNEQAAQNDAKNQQAKDALSERERHDQETEDLRGKLNDVRDRLATVQENKPAKGTQGTPSQFAGLEVKKQQALGKAHSEYQKTVSGLAPNDLEGHTQAAQDLQEAQQQAQDAYEQEIISLGGTAQHSDTSQWKGGSKAQPSPAAQAGGEKVNELGGRKVGDVGVVRGQRVKITNIYKNGKFDYEPVTAQ